jgi:hypothetical protein
MHKIRQIAASFALMQIIKIISAPGAMLLPKQAPALGNDFGTPGGGIKVPLNGKIPPQSLQAFQTAFSAHISQIFRSAAKILRR